MLLTFAFSQREYLLIEGGLSWFDLSCPTLEAFCCSALLPEYTTGEPMLSCGTISMWRRCYWFYLKVLPTFLRLLDLPLLEASVSRYTEIDMDRFGIEFAVVLSKSEGWCLGLPFHLGNYIFMEFGACRFTCQSMIRYSGPIVSRTE